MPWYTCAALGSRPVRRRRAAWQESSSTAEAARSSRSVSGPYRPEWLSTWSRWTCQASQSRMSSKVPAISVSTDPSTSITENAWPIRVSVSRRVAATAGWRVGCSIRDRSAPTRSAAGGAAALWPVIAAKTLVVTATSAASRPAWSGDGANSFESTGAGCRGEGDRQLDWTGVAAVGEPGGRASRAEVVQAAGKHGECRAHVRPRHQVAKAVVDAAAETEVRRPVCCGDVEVAATGLRIGSGRLAEQVDRGAGGDVEPVEAEAGDCLPGHPRGRGADPHDLLDRGRAQVRALAEQPPLARVVDEGLHGQAELVAGGIEAAEDQQHQRVAQFGGGQT